METKYVIITHNAEGHNFEESPLLDSYPKPELIEHYLNQGNYSFAKVEKRYSLGNFESKHTELNKVKPFYEVFYMTEDGSNQVFGTESKYEMDGFIMHLRDAGLPYRISEGEE